MSKPLLWNGGDLTINADTVERGEATAGAVTVSVKEGGGEWTPHSVPFHGNETNATAKWPASCKSPLAAAAGKTIQLEVVVTGAARLYALRGNFVWQ